MSAIDIAIAVALVVLVVLLVRAATILGHNPHQQIRAHEELAGRPFPPDMSHDTKLALIDRFGLSPTKPRRIWGVIVVVIAVLGLLVWQR